MKFGFIPLGVMPTNEWYIIDGEGKILDKGGPVRKDLNILHIDGVVPEYWLLSCCRWYNSMEELCEEQATEML